MLSKEKRLKLKELSRIDLDPERLEILRSHLGRIEKSKNLEKTRQYLAPNSALIAKGADILFVPKENILNYLQNTDKDIINLTKGDKYFARSVSDFLDMSAVEHPIYDREVIGVTALSPELTKICREDFHESINQKISNGEIPSGDQEFDFVVNSIIANPDNLGKALERGCPRSVAGVQMLAVVAAALRRGELLVEQRGLVRRHESQRVVRVRRLAVRRHHVNPSHPVAPRLLSPRKVEVLLGVELGHCVAGDDAAAERDVVLGRGRVGGREDLALAVNHADAVAAQPPPLPQPPRLGAVGALHRRGEVDVRGLVQHGVADLREGAAPLPLRLALLRRPDVGEACELAHDAAVSPGAERRR